MCQEESARDKIVLCSPFARLHSAALGGLSDKSLAQSYAYRPRPVHELYLYPAPGSLADIDATAAAAATAAVSVLLP